MSAMYKWTHLVHADLSEFNLLYWTPADGGGEGGDGRPMVHVIDLGQAVDTSHPLADEFLAADAANVTAFFRRKGVHVLPAEALIGLVKDRRIAPHPPSYGMRTGSTWGSVPAAGSGMPLLERMVAAEDTAMDATEGRINPVPTAVPDAVQAAAAAAEAAAVRVALASAGAAYAADAAGADVPEEAVDDDDVEWFDGERGPVVAAVDSWLTAHDGDE